MTPTVATQDQDPFHSYWKNHPHLADTPAEQPGGATPPPQLPPSPPKSPPSLDHGVLLQKHHQCQNQQQHQHQPPPSPLFLLRCTCRDLRHGQASLGRIKVCPGEAQGNGTICGWCERYHFTLTGEPVDRNNRQAGRRVRKVGGGGAESEEETNDSNAGRMGQSFHSVPDVEDDEM